MGTPNSMSFRPVQVRIRGHNGYDVVSDAHDALKLLATEWPIQSSPVVSRATLECLKALNDDAEPDQVRRAFIAAAREAHLDLVA
jgi:hypothetical protein